MSHIALKFRVPVALEEEFTGFLLTISNIEGIEEADGEQTFYIPSEDWSESEEAKLSGYLAERPAIKRFDSETIEQRDWNAEWEASIKPERITASLVITPSWHKPEAAAMGAKHTIVIDPKMSFGTGHHETTRLCLRALESIECTRKAVLDLGTGTGVLGIYALMLGADHAVGVDTDRWSIENANENRALNNVTPDRLAIRAGTLQETVRDEERFDIIVANIHRNVLVDLAVPLKVHANHGGTLILSGLLLYDADEVRTAFETAGFSFVRQTNENEWVCLVFNA